MLIGGGFSCAGVVAKYRPVASGSMPVTKSEEGRFEGLIGEAFPVRRVVTQVGRDLGELFHDVFGSSVA
jgi:hypothetical protein